jgi:erythromycin esterase-like protein
MASLTRIVRPLDGSARQFDPILERIGDASTVLIGGATHGSHELQEARTALTRQLIADRGFAAVMLEADWSEAQRINRYVQAEGCDRTALAALGDLERFPSWVWRNRVVERFVRWLRYRNDEHRIDDRAGIYGMDRLSASRTLDKADVANWNLRERHMMGTCEAVRGHLAEHGAGDKLVVWANNLHVQDARASAWRDVDQLSLGQLMRERHGEREVVIIGLSTHAGTVTAASEWDGPAEPTQLRPSLPGSWERALHEVGLPRGFVISDQAGDALDEVRLTRSVGAVYRPQTERESHYVAGRLGRQYDVILHYDQTRAVQGIDLAPARALEGWLWEGP